MSKAEEREARRAAREKAEAEQREKDLDARDELEDEHGAIASVRVARFIPGQPTCAHLRMPTGAEYKRYKDTVFRAKAKDNTKAISDAQEVLAQACWVYPREKKDREAMLEAFSGILTPIFVAATALAEGQAEEAGKD